MKGQKSRLKKHHLKKYSAFVTKGKSGVDKSLMREMYSNRMWFHDYKLLALLGLEDGPPRMVDGKMRDQPTEEKIVVINKLKKWGIESNRLHLNHIQMKPGRLRQVILFYNKEEHFFVEKNRVLKTIRKSIVYQSRERAFKAYNTNNVFWVDSFSLPPQDSVENQAPPQV